MVTSIEIQIDFQNINGKKLSSGGSVNFPDGKKLIILSKGRQELGNATGHPSFVMSASFSNQVLAQWNLEKPPELENKAYITKKLDEW